MKQEKLDWIEKIVGRKNWNPIELDNKYDKQKEPNAENGKQGIHFNKNCRRITLSEPKTGWTIHNRIQDELEKLENMDLAPISILIHPGLLKFINGWVLHGIEHIR